MNLLARLLPRLVYMNFGQVRPMPAREGQTVNFRRFNSLPVATTPLVEGITPGNNTPTISQLTVTPRQWGDWIEVTDILDFTAPDPVLTEFTRLLGEQAAQTMDIVTRDTVAAGTNVQYAGGVGGRASVASSNKISEVEIRKAVRTMQANKVAKLTSILNASTGVGTKPVAAGYVAIIGPSTLYDLKAETKFIRVEEYGSSAGGTLPFEVGAIDDVRFVLTNHPTVYTGAGSGAIDVHATLILGADAFGMISPMGIQNIVKDFGVNGNDPLNQRATTGWKAYYDAVILQQLAILRIEHAVSA
jgi:N4-gp56 family major capsid protein